MCIDEVGEYRNAGTELDAAVNICDAADTCASRNGVRLSEQPDRRLVGATAHLRAVIHAAAETSMNSSPSTRLPTGVPVCIA